MQKDTYLKIVFFFSSNKDSIALIEYRNIFKMIFVIIYIDRIDMRVYRYSISGFSTRLPRLWKDRTHIGVAGP